MMNDDELRRMLKSAKLHLEKGISLEMESDYYRMKESEQARFQESLKWVTCENCGTLGELNGARWGFETWLKSTTGVY